MVRLVWMLCLAAACSSNEEWSCDCTSEGADTIVEVCGTDGNGEAVDESRAAAAAEAECSAQACACSCALEAVTDEDNDCTIATAE